MELSVVWKGVVLLETECFEWQSKKRDDKEGRIEKCENVSGLFQVYFLLESWSTTLDLESVPVYMWLIFPL